ncbi:uncharacterized protein LOC110024962 [Phalaenopsis equestris]|uniref:uncharacterized protein LOC110024962 n=1 Tax=Phalaenopsis equestris TaxID=78828 RepID=UPI0009E23B10|nr:uncharacterized protein LOC110024962 [Phalaenopsis equestris]
METEKETAMWRFRRLLHIGRLLRFLELAGAIFVLSYSYSYIPPIARNSSAVLRGAVVVLISPTFVFLFGNAIVLVLFAKSGQITSTAEAPSALSDVDGSDEISSNLTYSTPPHLREDEEVVYEDKEVCVEIRVCTQSRSEEFERTKEEPKIRESKTEVSCDAEKFSPPPLSPPAAEDRAAAEAEEDAERFRRTVEEFIAKQQWFQRQESLSHISYSAGLPEPVAV